MLCIICLGDLEEDTGECYITRREANINVEGGNLYWQFNSFVQKAHEQAE